MANALRQQSMQPLETGRMAGRVAIPISPWEGAAKLMQGYASGQNMNSAQELAKALREKYGRERSDTLSSAMRQMQGSPQSYEDAAGNYAPQAAQAPNPMGALQSLAGSNDPMLAQAGATGMINQIIPKPAQRVDLGDRWGLIDQQNRIVGYLPKEASPDARLRAQTTAQTHATPSGSTLATVQAANQRHATPSGGVVLQEQGQNARFAGVSGNTRAQIGSAQALHDRPSGGAVLGAGTARRGQDISSETARRGHDISVDPALQGEAARGKAVGKTLGEGAAQTALDLPGAVATAEQSVKLVDQMIGDLSVDEKGLLKKGTRAPHPGFEVSVGASAQPGLQFVPGTDKAGFYALKDQVLGGAFMEAYKTLKGGGQITEIEGKKGTAAITRMNTAQNEAEFVKAAREFQDVVKAGVQRAKSRASTGVIPQRRATDVDRLLDKYAP